MAMDGFDAFDTNHDGVITREEFVNSYVAAKRKEATFPVASTFSSPPSAVSVLPTPALQVPPVKSAAPAPAVRVPWNSAGTPRYGQATVGSAEQPRYHVISSESVANYSVNGSQPQVLSRERLSEPPPNLVDLRRAQASGYPYGAAQFQSQASAELPVPAFDVCDRDGDGFITKEEFIKAVVGAQGTEAVSPTGSTLRWIRQPSLQYGDRRCWWSEQVPVPERNHGVTINAQYLTPPDQGREVFVHDDDGIYSRDWRHLGPFMRRGEGESLKQYLEETHANLYGAEDLLGERMKYGGGGTAYQDPKAKKPGLRLLHNFRKLKKEREEPLWQSVQNDVGREILNGRQIEEFFQNMDAVRYQPINYQLVT